MKSLLLLSVLLLTGCASQCKSHCLFGFIGPGNSIVDAYGNHYDNMDPCQYKGKPEGYKLADFCFANAGKRVKYIKDTNGKIIYTVN